ncbi:MAG: hypothetical protein ACTHN5_13315 [Phycisphaerae bacterium]
MAVVRRNLHFQAATLGESAIIGAFFTLLLLLIAPPRARAAELSDAEIQNHRCLTCHAQSHIAELTGAERYQMIAPNGTSPANEAAPRPGLYVPEKRLASSVHARVACVSCHTDARTLPHAPHMPPASCDASCHAKANSAFLHSAHATALAKGNPNAPRCATCHGSHDILPKSNRNARTFPLNIVQTCASCHEQHVGKTADGLDGRTQVANYLESVHGQGLLKAGLPTAATCADCHSAHDVRPSKDPDSTVNRNHVPETCGRCHVGIVETYAKSIHGTLLAEGNSKAPVCSDCHTAHAISRTNTPAFMKDIVAECGSCHDKPPKGSREKASLYETYRASYHGQVTNLGMSRAARCSDCHGAHNITRVDADNSPLNAANKVNVCRKCHPGADVKFAGFAPHADFRNSDRYPILHYVYLYFVVMMSASFGFFGLHCIFWAVRSFIERRRHGPEHKPDFKGPAIQRFNRVDRINHAFVIITFFGLALTGLPLLYSDRAWAQDLAAIFGGAKAAGIFHRIFAVMLIGNFVVHGVGVFRRFRKHGPKKMLFGPATMLPRKKDLDDLLGMFHWFFFGGQKPKFDRWTYWEKFDYMAEVGGSGIIGASGLLLWFPVFFSAFLPGWAFNVATIVHGFEALLAVGFIFTIHFFNANLRMEKFPVDDVMFTGRLPEEEFKHERGAEYERAVASGEIALLRVKPPPLWYHRVAVALGILAMSVGITIVSLIILAALRIL